MIDTGLMVQSARYLSAGVKGRLRGLREGSSLHAEDPHLPQTCKSFPSEIWLSERRTAVANEGGEDVTMP